MSQIDHPEIKTDLQLNGIEIFESILKYPESDIGEITTFNYNVGAEARFNPAEKEILIIVNVQIATPDQKIILGIIKTGCRYQISNFENTIHIKIGEPPLIPQILFDTLISISLSTTRGIMYSQFKGTFLNTAVLPILDPKAFKQEGTK